ncbi:hypothetical protein KIV56_04795 [Cryobacterium breve]|uniref:Flavodoxin-like domain-containing protein n=1 Tax=Cryobacterium breve TaxID=1259258 RepID=A0ABY7NIL1_9MICO|nr:flavodoxin domain-containing protein [Cryobacterium breve]WBM80706.1 hypothetical protein KIV56_04795 [Cryobacterium breve]
MSALVVFDSNYGTTESVAGAIADAIGGSAVSVATVRPDSLSEVDLLVVGCPINGWRPSPRMQAFLDQLHPGSLRGIQAAAFDTRIHSPCTGTPPGGWPAVSGPPVLTSWPGRQGSSSTARPDRSPPVSSDRAREWAGSIVTALAS